ncbi:ThuA domain-containing protein [Runella sp.]|uniref:ThuA domain-containing protein n=1 Tax=Runella sp. TaxID=1960881 RepID=UPI003D0B08E5
MKKWLKIVLISIVSIVVLLGGLLAGFIYKVKNGFPVSYETEKPALNIPQNQPAVLLFSKTTGFRHGESIDASKKMFADMAKQNHWSLYETEEGGAFNAEQLAKFNVVIFNNSTGEVINDEQKKSLEKYVENGGGLIGIHGSGDDSHHWEWYEKNLLGAKFSHHPLKPQLQKATLFLEPLTDSTLLKKLPGQWSHTDEWYVFFENPRSKGFNIIYTINGDKIIPNGNLLWIKDKNFGMGKDHPVAWFKDTGKGRTFYTSIGHTGEAFSKPELVQLLDNAIYWAGKITQQ